MQIALLLLLLSSQCDLLCCCCCCCCCRRRVSYCAVVVATAAVVAMRVALLVLLWLLLSSLLSSSSSSLFFYTPVTLFSNCLILNWREKKLILREELYVYWIWQDAHRYGYILIVVSPSVECLLHSFIGEEGVGVPSIEKIIACSSYAAGRTPFSFLSSQINFISLIPTQSFPSPVAAVAVAASSTSSFSSSSCWSF